ncbi:hypothetical protein BO94DRAFT_582764 [Aspergillus sclerotioniger CBS 115572]|uniref:Uncharacterized protein n=1 Tax=Aspergillus sclerotioniger CBS 115572 TaxID=1450535 RepID=A0A317X414_9EURO|nr:hypothetical protein BO94DRAFT_582764 [Aspergillus sclerotioniger CBS 115572]PWY93374.1 hypothetical protein BO94DRAFT_582764 [Aspergillus sclerotioniger CBS 115572]
MRFTIPFTLLLASLALAASPTEADNDVGADAEPAPVDTQYCRKGYDQCINNCRHHHGGNKCYRACWTHYCQ